MIGTTPVNRSKPILWTMPDVVLNLDRFLERHQLSRYQLAKELDAYAVGRSTAYAVAAGNNQPTLKTLGAIIAALRKLTGEEVTFADLLEYVEGEYVPPERPLRNPGKGRPAAYEQYLEQKREEAVRSLSGGKSSAKDDEPAVTEKGKPAPPPRPPAKARKPIN